MCDADRYRQAGGRRARAQVRSEEPPQPPAPLQTKEDVDLLHDTTREAKEFSSEFNWNWSFDSPKLGKRRCPLVAAQDELKSQRPPAGAEGVNVIAAAGPSDKNDLLANNSAGSSQPTGPAGCDLPR